MKNHDQIQEMLPFYANGSLEQADRERLAEHLASCADCRNELALWENISAAVMDETVEVQAPVSALQGALTAIQEEQERGSLFSNAWNIIASQVHLVRREIWPASLLILVLGFIITLIADKLVFFFAVSPLVAAAGLAFLYGKENDPAFELTLSTPTTQVQLLLARSALIFVYNLVISIAISLILTFFFPADEVTALIMDWLAPMAFLSTLGLCISVISSSENAITASYSLWLAKFMIEQPLGELFGRAGLAFRAFWSSPLSLYLGAALLTLITVIALRRSALVSQRLV